MKKKKLSPKQRIVAAFIAAVIILVSSVRITPTEEQLKSKVVMLRGVRGGGCSGEQIRAPSGTMYILSAGHCAGLADPQGNIKVISEDGRELKRRIIAEDPNSDLLLIEGLPNLSGLNIADSVKAPDHVRTFTHGRLLPTHKTEGNLIGKERIQVPINYITNEEEETACLRSSKNKILESFLGKVCALSKDSMAMTASITPGSSGGAVVNDSGELIGVASASDGYFGYIVMLEDIHAFVNSY